MRDVANAALAPILVVAAVLRLIHANAELWFDEIVAVLFFVRPPLATVVTSYQLAANHVLYSVLAHASASTLGERPWALRLPAIAFGVAGVWAFWFVASRVWPRTPALVGTWLFAISFHAIYYSQDARGYSAVLFFALLATGFLLRMVDGARTPRASDAIGYAVAIGLGLYAMLLMVFVVAGHATVLAVWRRWRPLAALAAGVALGALLYAPMAPSLIEFYRTHPADTGYPLLSDAFRRAIGPLALVLVVGGVFGLVVVARFARRAPMTAALLLAPLAWNVLAPLVRGQGVYPRSFIYGLAVAYLLLVEAIDWAIERWPPGAWALAGAVAIASAVQLVPFYQLPKQGFRQALQYIEQNRVRDDDRIGLTLGGKAVRFYDPSIALIEDAPSLRDHIGLTHRTTWIVSTFPRQLRSDAPDLYDWLQTQTSHRAEFPGVIGDGTVHVHYWAPARGRLP